MRRFLAYTVIIIILMLVALVSGCGAQQGAMVDSAFNSVIEVKNQIQERETAFSKFHICRNMTVEQWQKEFGYDREIARAWAVICSAERKQLPETR